MPGTAPAAATGTASRGAGGGAGARRPSLLDTEDLSKSGGWTRNAQGNLVPPPKKEPEPKPAAKTPEAATPPEKAPHTPEGARSGKRSGRRPSRGRRVSAGPVSVPIPGTPAGVLLALVLYPAGLAALKGGPSGLKNWFSAKFLNKVAGSAGASNSAWSAPSASAASAVNASFLAAGGGVSSSGSGSGIQTTAYTTAGASAAVAPVIAYALAQVGKRYVWAGAGPDGFDCSGLTEKAYATIGKTLPHSSALQSVMGAKVPGIGAAIPGDLIFPFFPVTHVAIYLGGGQLVEAANPSTGVRTAAYYGAAGGIRRIVT